MSSSSSYKREEIESQNFANEVYNYDWSSTPLGPMDSWDAGIKTATSLCLKSVFPICLFIGSPYWIQLYNKAWEPILQSKPYAIGKSVKETWPEVSDLIVPMFEGVRTSKKGIYRVDDYYELHRDGYIEEAYFDYTYSPVFKLDGSVWAVSTIAQETTQKVLTARRLKILGEFGRKMPEIESLEKACHITTDVLNNNKDIPYALVYFVESKLNTGSRSMIARLTSTTFDKDDKNEYQFPDYFPDTPKIIDLSKVINNYDDKYVTLKRHVATYSFLNCEESWPLDLVIKKEEPVKVILKDGSQAVLLLANTFCGDQSFAAILICGINRLRTLDEKYLEFLQLVLNQMNTCLLQGKTREEEKKRAKLLADLNSQKVMFFQGISHELKTPLTLMLSPLEDVINISAQDNLTTSKKYQILLVEDNADMRDYLAELLKEFDIHRARDGKDALRVLKKLNKLPDLILSDIMMPNMDGYQLLEVLRTDKRTQTIPIILVSARACEDSRVLGLDKGADDYLSKPFSARDLIARVRTNINLSILRRKIIFQQCRQEEIKQLLLLISEKVTSKLNLDETLQYVAKELYQILPCEKILIISNKHIESISNRIVALFEGSENITNSSSEIDDYYESESQNISNIQEFLKNNPGIDISFNVYCDDVCKDASILSVEIKLNNNIWGWIKAYRPSNSIWLVSEIELLQQISNQISLAVTYANLLEENAEKDIQIKAAEAASITKSQILANTSHELRTPLGAIVGILSSFDRVALTADQNDMINIMSRASDIVLSIINDILDAARLEAQKLTLINRTFYLSNLLEVTIEKFGKRAGAKNIELILNYDVDEVSRYVKSDPERLEQVLSHLLSNSVKFTDKGEIVLKISMQSRDVIDENEENPTYGQILKKENLLVELYDTGIGIDPKYAQNAWKSYSQGDMSVTKKQDGTGLGLSICKSLVEINGGEIKVESQLGKGSKFWFTWNIESLSITSSLFISQFDEINDLMKEKRILVIHPIESMRDAMLKYLKNFNKVDAFDSFDKGINAARRHEELYNKPAYDIAFISLYEDNEAEVMKAVLELKILINHNSLVIIFITFPSNTGIEVAEKLIRKTGGKSFVIYTPITWKKLINQFMHIYQYNIS
ncbi:protein-histidine kinase [Gigaspora margarita]|nr:protein-histidine kinase [Gigaspora margarita]